MISDTKTRGQAIHALCNIILSSPPDPQVTFLKDGYGSWANQAGLLNKFPISQTQKSNRLKLSNQLSLMKSIYSVRPSQL